MKKLSQRMVYFPMRLPAWLIKDLARIAEDEGRRDGGKANLSATARRAFVAYINSKTPSTEAPNA